jgi:hypothetical protein
MAMPELVVCSLLVNRLVRTRMLGGVGRAGSTPALTRLVSDTKRTLGIVLLFLCSHSIGYR